MINIAALHKTDGFKYGYSHSNGQERLQYLVWLLEQPSESAPAAVAKLTAVFEKGTLSTERIAAGYTNFRMWLFPTWPGPTAVAPVEWRVQADTIAVSWASRFPIGEGINIVPPLDVGYVVVAQIGDDPNEGLVLLEDFSWGGPVDCGSFPLSESRERLEKSIIPIEVELKDSIELVETSSFRYRSRPESGLDAHRLWAEWEESGYGPHIGVISDSPETADEVMSDLMTNSPYFASSREQADEAARERYPGAEPNDLYYDHYETLMRESLQGGWFPLASIWDLASYVFKYGIEPAELDQPEYKLDLDSLAGMFGIKTWNDLSEDWIWESGGYAHKETYDRILEETDDEDAAQSAADDAMIVAEQAEESEAFNNYRDAVVSVANAILDRGLGIDVDHPAKDDWQFVLTPKKDWITVAENIIETLNGEGWFHIENVQEFVDSGPYRSVYKAVIEHLSAAAQAWPKVYEGSTAQRMFERMNRY